MKKSELLQFVESLFETSKEPVPGIHIKMGDGSMCNVSIEEEINGNVTIKMNNVKMGHFEKMTQRGYKCRFMQQYRPKIRLGLTNDELFMMNICKGNPYILFNKAYN